MPVSTMQHQRSTHASGKLHFKAFREQHFGPDKINHWNQLFLPKGNKRPLDISSDQQHVDHTDNGRQQYEVEKIRKVNKKVRPVTVEKQSHESRNNKLSEHAIEIFRFSEAWKKEKAARLAELEKEEGKEKRTIFPESSAAHMDGTEPIATAIVLSNPQEKMDSTSEIQSLEHLVNFAYTKNCPQDTVLWPVLPLRL